MINVEHANTHSPLTYLEVFGSDARHIHKHDSRVHAGLAIIRMPCKAVIPGDSWLLMLRCHSCHVTAVKLGEKVPDLFHWLQEQDVRVHVEQRIHLT